MLIRAATIEDRPFLQAMIWEAVLASPGLIARRDLDQLQERETLYWNDWLTNPDPAFVALDLAQKPLGAIVLKPSLRASVRVTGWQFGVGIIVTARGQGIGTALIRRAIEFCRQVQADFLRLFVDPLNQQAVRLYEKLGFGETDRSSGLVEMRLDFSADTHQ